MSTSRRTFLHWAAGATGTVALAACGPSKNGNAKAEPGQGEQPVAKKPATGKKPTLLILGGTGFLGPAVVEAAVARGHQVTLFNRGKTNPHLFPDLEKLRGNRDGDLKALEGRKFDAVVDTSGYVPRVVGASASLLAKHTSQYVFISSVSVYANFKKPGISETYETGQMKDPKNEEVRKFYGQLKALSEGAAEAAMPGRVTNIRPGLIVGPRDKTDRFTYWPVRIKKGGEVLAPGDGKTATQYIDVRDLGEWIVHTIAKRHVGVYNATGLAQPLTIGSFLETCKKSTGSNATFTWADAKFLAEQKVAPWMQMPMWVPPQGDFAGFGAIDNRKAIASGLKFRTADDTIKATLAWFEKQPATRQAKLRAGLSAEREKAVLSAWHKRKAK